MTTFRSTQPPSGRWMHYENVTRNAQIGKGTTPSKVTTCKKTPVRKQSKTKNKRGNKKTASFERRFKNKQRPVLVIPPPTTQFRHHTPHSSLANDTPNIYSNSNPISAITESAEHPPAKVACRGHEFREQHDRRKVKPLYHCKKGTTLMPSRFPPKKWAQI